MKASLVWVLIVVVLLALGWYFWTHSSSEPVTEQTQAATQAAGLKSAPPITADASTTVSYDGKNFSPATLTIAKGATVSFVDTSGTMWVASGPHPNHDGYDGTMRAVHCATGYAGPAPFDECTLGNTFTFTFDKAGSWIYHDDLNESAGGTIIVQ